VTVLQVGDGFYEYIPPACVYPFFWTTGRIMRYEKGEPWWASPRWTKCVEPTAARAAGPNCCGGVQQHPNSVDDEQWL